MLKHHDEFTIEELAQRVGVPLRTIRYYITEGLLPGPGGRGKAAFYSEEHLLRLRLIRRLVEQRVPLSQIRERLSRLSAEDVRTLVIEQDQIMEDLRWAARELAPKEYVSELLKRAQEAGRVYSPRIPPYTERVEVPEPSAGLSGTATEPDQSAKYQVLRAPSRQSATYPELRAPLEPPARQAQVAEDSEPQAGPTMPAEGTWYRWEIEPGVELHIRSDLVDRYRYLIEILRRESGETEV